MESEINPILKSGCQECFHPDNFIWFVEAFKESESKKTYYFNTSEANKQNIMSRGAEEKFERATEYWLYQNLFTSLGPRDPPKRIKVRNHCHLAGKFR